MYLNLNTIIGILVKTEKP